MTSAHAEQAAGAARSAPHRVLVAKVGLDGHDRGLKIVARTLRDAGFEVIYAGLRQTPETLATIALQEDVDVIGLSMHTGAHLTLAAAVLEALGRAGLSTPVVLGGIIPGRDVEGLLSLGVSGVLTPGASAEDIVAVVRAAVRAPAGRSGPKR